MASRIKLIDVTRLKKSSGFATQQSISVLKQAKESIARQEEFMDGAGMDRTKLRSFINGDQWSSQYRHKARQELIRWSEELKGAIAHDVSVKRKEIRLASRLLNPKKQSTQSTRRRRTGFI